MLTVISLGGSIVAPSGVDVEYLSAFVPAIEELLDEDENRRFIFVVGGGAPARVYQNAFFNVLEYIGKKTRRAAPSPEEQNECADQLGIMATRLNAELVRCLFTRHCFNAVITDPTAAFDFNGRVLVASGWKPGFSSDNDAVLLASRFNSKLVINLSNIEKVYSADPKTDPRAKPLDKISWADFRSMVGNKWTPGKNLPFDPVAAANAEKEGIKVICAKGGNLENLKNIIKGGNWRGTLIG